MFERSSVSTTEDTEIKSDSVAELMSEWLSDLATYWCLLDIQNGNWLLQLFISIYASTAKYVF